MGLLRAVPMFRRECFVDQGGSPVVSLMRASRREVLSWFVGYGPTVVWVVFAVSHFGPARGYWRALGIALVVAIGALILWGIFLAWLPSMMETVGLKRFAAWLRHWFREGL